MEPSVVHYCRKTHIRLFDEEGDMREVNYLTPFGFKKRFVNMARSLELQTAIKAVEDYCWINAIKALCLDNVNGVYVEGWQVYLNQREQSSYWNHGWIEENGFIVDTYPDTDWENAILFYLPGVKYEQEELWKLMEIGAPPYAVKDARYVEAERQARKLFMDYRNLKKEFHK